MDGNGKQTASKLLLGAIVGLYLLPLFLAQRAYVDDLTRTVGGLGQWTAVGRPLADVVSWVINLGYSLTDISPLPQLVGVAAVAGACWLVATRVFGNEVPEPVRVGTAALILLNPLLLQNMSYKFDAASMGMSILVAVIAATQRPARLLQHIVVVALLTVVSLALYQSAVNVTLALACGLACLDAKRGERPGTVVSRFGGVAGGVALALAIYAVVAPMIVSSPYALGHSGALPPGQFVVGVYTNIVAGIRSIQTYHSPSQFWGVVVVSLVAQIYCLVIAVRIARRQGLGQFWLAVLVLLSPAAALVSTVGTLAVLKNPVFSPRVFLAYGVFLAFVVYLAVAAAIELAALVRLRNGRAVLAVGVLVAGVPALSCIDMAYAVGNAQRAQAELDAQFVERAWLGWYELGAPVPATMVILGNAPRASRVGFQARRYPLVNTIVASYLAEGSYFGPLLFRFYGYWAKNATAEEREQIVAGASGVPPGIDDPDFTMTRVGDSLLLEFKTAK